ncbi:MAG: hypothetical protein ABIP49_03275, partial [Lysobacterales bacterium]
HGGPDLVVTDITLTGMSGPDVATRLVAKFGAQRVLFLSGFNESVLGDFGSPEINFRFLQKPFTADAFAQTISDLLRSFPDSRLEKGSRDQAGTLAAAHQ